MSGRELCEGRAQVRRRIVPELHDRWMAFERGLHDAALHAAPAPVHQTYFGQALGGGGRDVLVDHRRDVARSKRVQIELAFNRKTHTTVSEIADWRLQIVDWDLRLG
jgi:hypothetical protein